MHQYSEHSSQILCRDIQEPARNPNIPNIPILTPALSLSQPQLQINSVTSELPPVTVWAAETSALSSACTSSQRVVLSFQLGVTNPQCASINSCGF